MKEIIDKDHEDKKNFKARTSELSKSNDFADNSYLSYLYKKKEHQSFALGNKKDYIIGLMQNKFQS